MSQTTPRLFASTRGKIVTLLRRASRTVEELAEALLTSLVDAPVQERCEYGETLWSHFIVPGS